jgi:hypothetical protein
MRIIILFLAISLLFVSSSKAAEIVDSNASYRNDIFYIDVVGVVDGSKQKVFDMLNDYNNLTKISPKIVESVIIKQDGQGVVVKTVARGCVLFFCKNIVNTQTVTVSGSVIVSSTLPEQSNLKFGKMKWVLKEDEKDKNKTVIEYSAEVEPDFFVPPLIGGYFIKSYLLSEAENFIDGLEKAVINDQ